MDQKLRLIIDFDDQRTKSCDEWYSDSHPLTMDQTAE
jgi:hypothetical protein